MAKIDYNSSTFRNAAIDKFQGKFGQPTKRSASATNTSSSTLANPFQQKTPLAQGLGDTSIKRPAAPKAPAAPAAKTTAKPETKPTAMASEVKKPAPSPESVKTAKQAAKVAIKEAKGQIRVEKIKSRGSKTTEERMALREKRAENFGKAVKGTFETVGTALGLYGTYQGLKKGN